MQFILSTSLPFVLIILRNLYYQPACKIKWKCQMNILNQWVSTTFTFFWNTIQKRKNIPWWQTKCSVCDKNCFAASSSQPRSPIPGHLLHDNDHLRCNNDQLSFHLLHGNDHDQFLSISVVIMINHQVLPHRLRHIRSPPSSHEIFYEPTGKEAQPRPIGSVNNVCLYSSEDHSDHHGNTGTDS